MLIDHIKEKLCNELVVGSTTVGDRSFLSSRFQYPDGDYINVYFYEQEEGLVFSDNGATIHKMHLRGMQVSQSRIDAIKSLISMYDVNVQEDALIAKTSLEDIPARFISFCKAIERAGTLQTQFRHRKSSQLAEHLDFLLRSELPAERGIARDWVDEAVDSSASYPVDFHLNSTGRPCNIFAVTSREKGTLVSAVCNYLKAHGREYPSMAVLDHDRNIPERSVERVRSSCEHIVFGISGFEDRIIDFAKSGRL